MLHVFAAMMLSPLVLEPAPVPAPSTVRAVIAEEHGKLPWFKGSFEEVLAEAKSKQKIVFIDLWREN